MSGFDWTGSADNAGRAPIMDEGWHKAKCIKVITAKGQGEPLTTSKGDPKIICVLANFAQEEATITFTLTDKAGGFLAHYLKCCGADLERMKANNVTPQDFQNADFAKKNLEDRECWVYITHSQSNGKTYANAEAHEESDVPVTVVSDKQTQAELDTPPF